MIILGNDEFGEKLARLLGSRYVKIEKRVFPDGEACPRIIGDINDNHVVIAMRMLLPLDPNRYLTELLLTIKNLRSLGVSKIDVVMPYFVYARQDKVFRSGEPFSAKYVLELLKDAGATRFFTVTSHADRNNEIISLADLPAYNIDGFVAVGNYLKKSGLSEPIIIAPDSGAEKFAETVARQVGCEYTTFEKHRNLDTGEVVMKSNAVLSSKDAVIVDDIISSGSTMIHAMEICKKKGARNVMCAVIHVVSEKAIEKIPELVATDTIGSKISRISVADLVAEKMKTII